MDRQSSRLSKYEEYSKIDYGIILPVLILSIIGISSIYVAAAHHVSGGLVLKEVLSQVVWYFLGVILVIILIRLDAKRLWNLAPIAYGLGIFLLIMILFFYSRYYANNFGSKGWFAIGSLTFQPVEFMKPAYILMMAKIITTYNDSIKIRTVKTDLRLIGKMLIWTLPVLILILLQNDFGTMLVFVAIFIGFIIISGITWRLLIPIFSVLIFSGTVALALAVTNSGRNILEKFGFSRYQFIRIDVWLHPDKSTSQQGFQLWQSMKAIGSGGLFGKGYNVTNVTVPVRESDMIFSVIGENFGLIGGVILVFLYFLLIFNIIKVTFDTKNEFYSYISTGIIMMILFHVFENIGMAMTLLPMTGIPLPFVSAGGSALISNMIGIGMVMSMRYHYISYMNSFNKNDTVDDIK